VRIWADGSAKGVTAKVGVGSTVYVAGAGPVGLAAAASAHVLGAAAVLIGDMNKERLDCAIDCVGFEAKAQGKDGQVIQAPAVVLNSLMMEITRAASAIGFPGLYVTTIRARRSRQPNMATSAYALVSAGQSPTPSTPARHRC
jgi:threonine dehydrogenase-like Zn-dependent dehydrogenase